ncbi:MAG: TlpA family protein disulfide reductase [Sphingobacterium sp.]|jgi:thiol-disulfide isomerase/thioredoxin|uniref:TlpA family protein disulfide reductase n=1 Tax=Sphingobacterium sp. TaxID=341027 RepID=UPI0028458144|nr:TlpA disulfide reductase family protein [Sphingobacterium sp.]MDR3007684.1 TlpA family protein disulfide reductase [Sphingobacterium sp.]
MKKIIIFLLMTLYCLSSHAQFKLSGRIWNYDPNKVLEINIPLVFGFYKENSQRITVAGDGTFEVALPITARKSATLIYSGVFQTLLLSPGKDLIVNLTDSTIVFINGSALTENKTIQQIKLDEVPFFMKAPYLNNLAKLSLTQLKQQVLIRCLADCNQMNKVIQSSSLSTQLKDYIHTELYAQRINHLNDFARVAELPKSTSDSLILELFEKASINLQEDFGGPSFYSFLDNYLRYLETKAFVKIRAEKIPSSEPIPYFGISLDSANRLMTVYSKDYWRFIGALNNFSKPIVEKYNFQQLVNLYHDRDLTHLKVLAEAHWKIFLTDKHKPLIESYIADLDALLVANKQNKQIRLIEDDQPISSIYDLIAELKGKVVYLDVWGTWCGPCKFELKYTPELKKRYMDKDIAFVYLDMDEDNRDQDWKDFIRINNLTGTHLRKNRTQISPFWKELLLNAKDKAEYYPQYFIFDKTGKLVVEKALRPSNGKQLYDQLDQILNQ